MHILTSLGHLIKEEAIFSSLPVLGQQKYVCMVNYDFNQTFPDLCYRSIIVVIITPLLS